MKREGKIYIWKFFAKFFHARNDSNCTDTNFSLGGDHLDFLRRKELLGSFQRGSDLSKFEWLQIREDSFQISERGRKKIRLARVLPYP